MEDLAHLISGSISDMSQLSASVKPDKCAILQDTIDQLERLKQEGTGTSAHSVSSLGLSSCSLSISFTSVCVKSVPLTVP